MNWTYFLAGKSNADYINWEIDTSLNHSTWKQSSDFLFPSESLIKVAMKKVKHTIKFLFGNGYCLKLENEDNIELVLETFEKNLLLYVLDSQTENRQTFYINHEIYIMITKNLLVSNFQRLFSNYFLREK